MIFYCDLQGNLKAFQNETVYQGSNNVTTIYVVAPFNRPVGLNISFTKPNKLVTSPAIMKWVGTLGNVKIPVSFVNIPEQFTETYNVWAYALPYSITEQNGVVGVSVNAVIADSVDASGQQAYKGNLTTFTGQFTVAYSALPSPPTDIPTEWTQDKVLDLLNNYYNDAIQKIGEMNTLKTDAKDTLVKAINEVFDEIASTNATIGDLSTLTTDEKTTIVGAINEVDAHADTAQQTADNATNLANTGISKADQAQATADNATNLANTGISKADRAQTTANTAVDKANDAKATAQEAIMKADGRATSIGFMTAKDAVTALNGYPRTQLKGGDTIWIVETGTPDLWVTEVAQESVPYNYTTKDKFNQDLVDNKVLQIGYFKTAYQESDGKPVTIAWQNVLVKSTDWVASTEFADFPYEAKIELTDFVDYTTVPQVVFDIADTMSGNYAPICKSGDKCVYIYGKVQDEITLKTVITFAPNVNGASVTGGGYNNRGKWVASTTYAIDDLVYTDNGQYVCIDGITSTTSPEQDTQHWQATFVATGKTKNALTISGQDNGTEVQKTFDGSTAMEVAFDETTMTAKEVDGVLKVGAKGTVPEALPAIGAKITGNLPTSGWDVKQVFFIGSNAASWEISTANGLPFLSDSKDIGLVSGNQYTMTVNKDGIEYTSDVCVANNIGSDMIQLALTFSQAAAISFNIYDHAIVNSNDELEPSNGAMIMAVLGENPPASAVITEFSGAGGGITATISNSAIKTNSAVTMYIDYSGKIKAEEKTDGSITVSADETPTENIPYTLQVVETSTEGAFEIVNSYLPTIPETPTALPQTAGALKSGNLPTSGWTNSAQVLLSSITLYENNGDTGVKALNKSINSAYYNYTGLWEFLANGTPGTQISSPSSIISIGGKKYRKIPFVQWANMVLYIDQNGNLFSGTKSSYLSGTNLKALDGLPVYTISDTDITENSDVLMELTDEGGVKAYSLASGSITLIRDTVPTTAIHYTYKVKQTNASGQFTLVNHFVPTIPEVPTTTTLYEDSTGAATVTLSETINNGDIVRIKTNNGNVDNYYIGVAWNRAITVTESFMVTDASDVTVGTAINIYSLRFNIQDTSLILFHYFKTNITTAGAVTITNEKANVVIRKVERIHT